MDRPDVNKLMGPLAGLRVVEVAGLGPVTFAAMLLADMGAHVARISRPGHVEIERGATLRGRTQLTLDLRSDEGKQCFLELLANADVLLEGFRPGVMERLKLGPREALVRNPRLVFGRMTGWGQSGPHASTAGHDINYIATAGELHAIGGEDPAVPLNLVGDFGGGALYLAMGVLAAVLHARATGTGQVVDCAICDGTASLLSLMHGLRAAGRWKDSRLSNTLDGAAPYYRTYRCKDDAAIAVGAIEPQFYAILLRCLGLQDDPLFADQHDRARWQDQAATLQRLFAGRTRAEWMTVVGDTDACVSPVNSLAESLADPHLLQRRVFVAVGGEQQPAPAPRFSSTTSTARPSLHADDIGQVLEMWRAQPPNNRDSKETPQ